MTTELTSTSTALEGVTSGKGDVHVYFILDRSGSMQGSEADVIGGFNSFVATLRGQTNLGTCTISATRCVRRAMTAIFIPRGAVALKWPH